MSRHLFPVLPRIPRDRAGMVDFHGHDLADACTVEDDNEGAKASFLTTPCVAGLNLRDDDGVADVSVGNDMGG